MCFQRRISARLVSLCRTSTSIQPVKSSELRSPCCGQAGRLGAGSHGRRELAAQAVARRLPPPLIF